MQRSYKACCSARIMYLCSWSLEMIKCKRFCVCTRSFQKTRYLQHCTISHDRKTSKTCRSCNKKGSAMQCCWCCVKPSRRSSLIWHWHGRSYFMSRRMPVRWICILCALQAAHLFTIRIWISQSKSAFPGGLVVRISRSHRDGRGSIPRLGRRFCFASIWACIVLHFCFVVVLFVGCNSLSFMHKP